MGRTRNALCRSNGIGGSNPLASSDIIIRPARVYYFVQWREDEKFTLSLSKEIRAGFGIFVLVGFGIRKRDTKMLKSFL